MIVKYIKQAVFAFLLLVHDVLEAFYRTSDIIDPLLSLSLGYKYLKAANVRPAKSSVKNIVTKIYIKTEPLIIKLFVC
jgi:hypothetical protein